MSNVYYTPAGQTYNLFTEALRATHLLIAGATGSGKSVLENGLISTLLYRVPNDQAGGVQLILIDPKRVELVRYRDLPHVLRYASEPEEMRRALYCAVGLMDARYRIMQQQGHTEYQGGDIYVIIDEFADLMTTDKKEITPLAQRLAQLGRAAKVHVILCTQCPLAEVIPTKIRANFDVRFCLRTATRAQSNYIMNAPGCELLPNPRTEGRAEGYYCDGADRTLYEIPYVGVDEIQRLISYWTTQIPHSNRSKRSDDKPRASALPFGGGLPAAISARPRATTKAARSSSSGCGGVFAFLLKAACAFLALCWLISFCAEHFE